MSGVRDDILRASGPPCLPLVFKQSAHRQRTSHHCRLDWSSSSLYRGQRVGHAKLIYSVYTSVEKRMLCRLLSGVGMVSSWRKYSNTWTCKVSEKKVENNFTKLHKTQRNATEISRGWVFITCAITSRDQLSPMLMGCVGLAGILLSFSAGLSKVGPNTVAKLWRDILLTLSFSATLEKGRQASLNRMRPSACVADGDRHLLNTVDRVDSDCFCFEAILRCDPYSKQWAWNIRLTWIFATQSRLIHLFEYFWSLNKLNANPKTFINCCSAWVCTFMSTYYASGCVLSCLYLFMWSKRKRNVTRFGSGSDNSKFNMQLSLATLSDRAAQKTKESCLYTCVPAATAYS